MVVKDAHLHDVKGDVSVLRRPLSPSPPRAKMERAISPPPNCRIFIGNLFAEKTSSKEVESIFAVYGKVIDVVSHASFGFIQYDNVESAQAAIAGNSNMCGYAHTYANAFPVLFLDLNIIYHYVVTEILPTSL